MISIGPYDYDNLIRSYLAQDRPKAATAGDRMSYSGTALYSYSSKLAVIHNHSEQILFINKDLSSYSVTTTKQINKLYGFIGSWSTFTVSFDKSPNDNLAEYWQDINELIGKHNRARTAKGTHRHSIHSTINKAKAYAPLFNLDPEVPTQILQDLFKYKLLN